MPFGLAGGLHLEFAGHGGAGEGVGETETRTGGGLGEEDCRIWGGGGDRVVDDVALVVEVDGFEGLVGRLPKDVEQVAVFAIEVRGAFAVGVGGGVAGEDLAGQFRAKGVDAAGGDSGAAVGFGLPTAFEEGQGLEWVRFGVGLGGGLGGKRQAKEDGDGKESLHSWVPWLEAM